MTDPDSPAPLSQAPKPTEDRVFTQANLTTGLAVLAVILAAAPYVVPQIQAWQVRAGLLSQPAMLEQAQSKLQTQKADEAAKTASVGIKARHDSIFNDKSDPVINPKGTIKVVEFLDYQCTYCRAATPLIKQFLADNPDVQLVVKEYPVVHPPSSNALAAYGLAAYNAGHYESVHYDLLTQQIGSQEEMDALMKKAGLDPSAAKAVATSPATLDKISKTVVLGSDLGINGTPTFIVGDKMINGADTAALRAAVAAERAKMGKT